MNRPVSANGTVTKKAWAACILGNAVAAGWSVIHDSADVDSNHLGQPNLVLARDGVCLAVYAVTPKAGLSKTAEGVADVLRTCEGVLLAVWSVEDQYTKVMPTLEAGRLVERDARLADVLVAVGPSWCVIHDSICQDDEDQCDMASGIVDPGECDIDPLLITRSAGS